MLFTVLPLESNSVSAPTPSELSVNDARVTSLVTSANPGRPSGVMLRPIRCPRPSPSLSVGAPSAATSSHARSLPEPSRIWIPASPFCVTPQRQSYGTVFVEHSQASGVGPIGDFQLHLAVLVIDP